MLFDDEAPFRAAGAAAARVVLIHGAGRHLEGLVDNGAALARALAPGTRLVRYDAARTVGIVRVAASLFGARPFGYSTETLSRSDYDRGTVGRIVEDLETFQDGGRSPGRTILIGHSLGAAMVVEVVERLAAHGRRVDDVLLLDRMFFEWRWGAFFGIRPRMPRLTVRGARSVSFLHEVLVSEGSLSVAERLWVSLPAGGHVPLDPAVAGEAGVHRREWAPPALGHGALAWWSAPFERIAARWAAREIEP